jgi:hypothetical protein
VSRNFSPSLSVKKYATKSLRLELDLSLIKNSICIDAIQVTGVEGKKMAEVHDEEFLMESLLLYYNNQEFSDMAFICGDKKIYAHTTLVHTLCPGLVNSKDVVIDNASFETLSLVVKYVYSGLILITVDNVNEIIRLADKFGLNELKSSCFTFLLRSVDKDTVCDLILRAREKKFDFNADDLVASCLRYIDENTFDVLESEKFILLPEDLVIDILKSDTTQADELTLFKAMVRWGTYQVSLLKDPVPLPKFLEKVAGFIRYPGIDPYELVFTIKPTKIAPHKLYMEAVEYHARPERFEKNPSSQFKARGFSIKGSTILTPILCKHLDKWFEKKPKGFELLYKGGTDGFKCTNFHSKCDNKGATLVVIKSIQGNIFGGFSLKPWNQSSVYSYDKDSWLFSLVNKTGGAPCKLKSFSNNYGTYGNSSYGPTFGGGFDLYISDNCSSGLTSYSNLGHSYATPSGITYGTVNAQNFLAGSYYFQVQEIEVFLIKT